MALFLLREKVDYTWQNLHTHAKKNLDKIQREQKQNNEHFVQRREQHDDLNGDYDDDGDNGEDDDCGL